MKFTKIALSVALGLGAAAANAVVPVYTSFDWETSTGFLDETFQSPLATLPVSFTNQLEVQNGALLDQGAVDQFVPQEVEWGTPASPINPTGEGSKVAIGNQDSDLTTTPVNSNLVDFTALAGGAVRNDTNIGTVYFDNRPFDAVTGDWVAINSFTHTNNVIRQVTEWEMQIQGGLRITTPVVGPDLGSPDDVTFFETLNVDNGNCTFNPGNGVINPLGTQCDDIFFADPLSGESPLNALLGLADDSFTYFIETSTVTVPGVAGNVSELGDGTLVIHTAEASIAGDGTPYVPGVSTIFTAARIIARPVPEPGVIALFGAGLLGMGLRMRNRKRA